MVCGRSPSLTLYSPYHHTYSMCISTVHYCCHRNVMHSVSYRLTQLNGKPCLICSGSFILILKGIVNTVWRREGGGGEGTRGWKNNGAEGGWILPSLLFSTSLPIIPFLSLPLMSVLSISSQCELVAIIYTHCSYIILRTYCYILYHSVTLCVLVSLIGSGWGRWCFQRHWNCWYSLCGS